MEYLMTYGWAILIIAVVLGVLFQLGIFSGSALAPKAQPGSCQVQRLLGQVSLEGECQGQLPQYVAGFDGSTGVMTIPNTAILKVTASSGLSYSFWIYPLSFTAGTPQWMYTQNDNVAGIDDYCAYSAYSSFDCGFYVSGGCYCDASLVGSNIPPNDKWSLVTVTFSIVGGSTTVNTYLNGGANVITSPFASTVPPSNGGSINVGEGGGTYCKCYIANVQIYNTTLSASEVKALYLEGIGGAPIRAQNLVGWWPLNGNMNDYSGYNHNGALSGGIFYNSTWNAQYAPP